MNEKPAISIGVVIVAYKPDIPSLRKLTLEAVSGLEPLVSRADVFVWDNSPAPQALAADYAGDERVTVMAENGGNIGFGAAVNRVIERTQKDWYIVLNQDLRIAEGALTRAVEAIRRANPSTAVLEFAHRSREHPKQYDPVSRETPWFSGAAFCVSRDAFMEAGGFDHRLFMYGEDVDLSFRFRLNGMRVVYLPDCIVFHDDIVGEHGQKPLQEVYDRANNILLRIKYGSALVAMRGILWLMAESLYFRIKGRKIDFRRVLSLVSRNARAFWMDRMRGSSQALRPAFDRWKYCRHRSGGSYLIDAAVAAPKVSIVIRTMNRPKMLTEAIQTALNQTYRDVQVVVVDDGAGQGQQVVEAFLSETGREILYVRTAGGVGRAAAGNIGLSHCSGEFMCFLDEDDQLYADHVEVLIGHSINNNLKLSYALAEEVLSEYTDDDDWTDGSVSVRYRQEFSRVLLWYKNYIPIQSAIFSRALYEDMGGFDETLDLYEDWSLWVKYSTKVDFGFVPKTTSRYRIFTNRKARSTTFGDSYVHAASKHDYQGFTVSPVDFRRMVAEYIRQRCLLCLTRERVVSAQRSFRSLLKGKIGR